MLFLNQKTRLKEDAIIGLIFTSFQADIAEQFIPVQRSLDQLDAPFDEHA